jgi:outer membrane protein OmpA-like peptidoglycan-associated protein
MKIRLTTAASMAVLALTIISATPKSAKEPCSRTEIRFPSVYFKANSIVFDTLASHDEPLYRFPTPALDMLADVLQNNPTITVELDAHCSMDEADPEALSQRRADKVKDALAARGVEGGRLIPKGFGISKMLIKPEMIEKAQTVEEKAALQARNRRCTYRILSWDYPVRDTSATATPR